MIHYSQAIVLSQTLFIITTPIETVIRRHVSLLTADPSAEAENRFGRTRTSRLGIAEFAASLFLFLSLFPEQLRAAEVSPPRSAITHTYGSVGLQRAVQQ